MTSRTITELLGGPSVLGPGVTTETDLASYVSRGLPATSLAHLVKQLRPLLSVSSIYAVVGSQRTLQRKQQHGQRLSREESNRLRRLARVAVRAQEALGAQDAAFHWLVTANRDFEGCQPLELLCTEAGATAVEDVLGRIEHGVYS